MSGTTSGYHGYSSSMQNADIVWDEKNLEQFSDFRVLHIRGVGQLGPQSAQVFRKFTISARASLEASPEYGFMLLRGTTDSGLVIWQRGI